MLFCKMCCVCPLLFLLLNMRLDDIKMIIRGWLLFAVSAWGHSLPCVYLFCFALSDRPVADIKKTPVGFFFVSSSSPGGRLWPWLTGSNATKMSSPDGANRHWYVCVCVYVRCRTSAGSEPCAARRPGAAACGRPQSLRASEWSWTVWV